MFGSLPDPRPEETVGPIQTRPHIERSENGVAHEKPFVHTNQNLPKLNYGKHELTHEEMRRIAVHWLTSNKKCSVILSELSTAAGEMPDAIGWKYGASFLVECKISRSDFHANREKPHVRYGGGAGAYRYFLVPGGLIDPEEMAKWDHCDGYGLLWINNKRVSIKREAEHRNASHISEIAMLTSALRRVRTREFLTIVPGVE